MRGRRDSIEKIKETRREFQVIRENTLLLMVFRSVSRETTFFHLMVFERGEKVSWAGRNGERDN